MRWCSFDFTSSFFWKKGKNPFKKKVKGGKKNGNKR